MITIENLEVQFDVDGNSDEQVFAQYFARFIEQWQREQHDASTLQKRLTQDQQLGTDGAYR